MDLSSHRPGSYVSMQASLVTLGLTWGQDMLGFLPS